MCKYLSARDFIPLLFAILASLFIIYDSKADHRLDLQTNTIHIPYNQADADQELKLSDGNASISTAQLANGNYNGAWYGILKYAPGSIAKGVDLNTVNTSGNDRVSTTCPVTQGVIVDENGNTYTSNRCRSTIKVIRTERQNRYHIEVELLIYNAAAANAAQAAAANIAGMGIAERQGLTHKISR